MKAVRFFQVPVLIMLILAGYQWLTAAYLTDIPVQISQPNGIVIDCFASGDEYHNWLHDADGYTIIQSPNTGYYTYAIQTGDTVSASDFIVGITDPQIAGLTPGINISEAEYQLRRAEAFTEPETRNAPTTGTINNIVIFIRFSGEAEFGQPISTYNGWFNNNTSSLKNYFLEASYGLLTVTSTFYPTPTTMVVSWQDSHQRGYYRPYNATTNTIGYQNQTERRIREHTLLANAVNGVNSLVPTGLNIDGDNDGIVDNVCFIIKGSSDAWGSLLWPHRWSLYTHTVYINNKQVFDYNFQLQNFLTDYNVGVLSHEFFHSLGAPDLYRYSQNPPTPVGIWDVMAETLNPPQQMGAYMKWKYGGWIPAPTVIRAHQTYTLNPVTSSTNNVYRINSPNSTNEYFIVEYRKKSGTYENNLPGSGLLIYRINSSAGNGNASEPPDEVYIYRPNGTLTETGNINSAHYSSQTGRTSINATTNPTPFLSNGNPGGLDIDQIGSAGNTISFRLGIIPYTSSITGTVSLNSANQGDVVLTTIKLRYTNNHAIVDQKHPNSNGSYSFNAFPGNYYLEYELFQPSLNKYYYPVTSEPITVLQETDVIELPLVTLTQYNINSPKVSANLSFPYFKTIDQALQRIQTAANGGYNGNTVTLDVLPGNYYWPQTNSQPVGNFSYTNTVNNALTLVIRSAGNGAIIEPQYDDYYTLNIFRTNIRFQNIKFSRAANNWNYYLTFHGTNNSSYSFIGCLFGIQDFCMQYKSSVSFADISGITFYNCSIQGNDNTVYGDGVLKFDNCSNIDLNNCNFTYNMSYSGGAIHLLESSNVRVRNSLFEYNNSIAPDSEIPAGTPGGAIYIKLSTNIRIDNNHFIKNFTSGGGGPVYFNNTSMIHIENNLFKDNVSQPEGYLIPTHSDALGFENCTFSTDDILLCNIIHSSSESSPEYQHNNDFIYISNNCTGTLRIVNGVFIKGSLDNNDEKKIIRSFSPINMNFTNCVFQTRDVDADFSNSTYPPQSSSISVTYSLFDNEITGATTEFHNTYNVGDMALDSNYMPIWNQTTMSPCIDSGNPNSPRDPDGSPADIGAIRAIDHGYWQYRFRSGENERGDTYHWVGYPVVNSLTQGKTIANTFFKELLGKHTEMINGVPEWRPDVLQEILWSDTDGQKEINWDGSGWGDYVDSLNVVSPQGFKIKLLPLDGLPPTTVELHHSGFLTPANTPFMIYGSNSNGGQTYENWIGYFDTESSWPDDAFSSIWNDITMIKAKDWCLYRDPDSGIEGTIGTMLPINCGDMVIVTTRNDHEFQWDTTNPTDPIKKKVPIAFNYVEMADYTPVYLDLSGTDITDLQEIGLKLDGVCKGAVVVTDTLEQICAYLDEGESLNSGLVELEFFYESKSQPQEMRCLAINNKQLSGSFIGGDPSYPVYNIKVSTEEPGSTVVPVLSLEQNYPNPFNPTTTIRYSIDEPGPVSLDIYNIKGQLVKSLYRGTGEVGSHSAIWDGLDKSGNACSSGVYFYR
ncbi:MAG: M6 family metalloprotease domain-containing protein, partial [Candidatus Cloacimonetes bacterium]|nr:M6 family metalloprotease domain-containing protein [Candidatus Cloacimonadota bacterium]